MQIVLITDTFPPLRSSGSVQLRDLAQEFTKQGHKLTVLLPDSQLETRWKLEEYEGATILRLKAPQSKDRSYLLRTVNELLMPFAMLINLNNSPMKNKKWEAVIWYSPSIFHAPLVKRIKTKSKCKSYLILRDIFPDWALDLGLLKKGLAYWFLKWVAQKQYDAANIIGVQSPGNISYFEKSMAIRKGQSVEVLQNWLARPSSSSCSIIIKETSLIDKKVLVYAGNMGVAQDIELILNLAERMLLYEDVGFLFVGRGNELERLKTIAQNRKLDNVLFRDEINPDEIPDLFRQCSAGIVSLDIRHNTHNIPGKFLTYMQSGLPVLASINNGNDLAELIEREKVGKVCQTGSLDELEHKCLSLLNQIETDSQLASRCKSLFMRNFSVSIAVNQIVNSLNTVHLTKTD